MRRQHEVVIPTYGHNIWFPRIVLHYIRIQVDRSHSLCAGLLAQPITRPTLGSSALDREALNVYCIIIIQNDDVESCSLYSTG